MRLVSCVLFSSLLLAQTASADDPKYEYKDPAAPPV